MIHPSISKYLPEIRKILESHKIKSAFLFGSSLTNSFNENSDLDILVNLNDGMDPLEAGENLWNLNYEIEDLIQRKIDLHTERSLKNPFFIEEVNRTKILIYG